MTHAALCQVRALESRVPTHMGGHHGVRRTPCFPSPLSHSPRPRVCVFRCQAAAGCSGVLFHQCPPGEEGLFVYRSSPSVSAGETKRIPWCACPDLRDMAMRWPLASHLSAWAPVCFLLPRLHPVLPGSRAFYSWSISSWGTGAQAHWLL